MPPAYPDLIEERHPGESLPAAKSLGFRQFLPDRRNQASREQLLRRVRNEYEELGGLNLTLAQARRLFGVRDDVCLRVLNKLIRDGVLRVSPENLYVRRRLDP
jgi:hypothetical protein